MDFNYQTQKKFFKISKYKRDSRKYPSHRFGIDSRIWERDRSLHNAFLADKPKCPFYVLYILNLLANLTHLSEVNLSLNYIFSFFELVQH